MRPVQLGITGGIGSGKSIICKILTILGIPVYHADEASKKLLETDRVVINSVTILLGEEAYFNTGKANRSFIANIVFSNPEKLKLLNAILHPAVQNDYLNWVVAQKNSAIVAKEAAIMFESGSHIGMDYVIVVTAPTELRIKRVVERDGKSPEAVHLIMKQQLDQNEVIAQSDFTIINDDHHLVIPQILKIMEHMKGLPN